MAVECKFFLFNWFFGLQALYTSLSTWVCPLFLLELRLSFSVPLKKLQRFFLMDIVTVIMSLSTHIIGTLVSMHTVILFSLIALSALTPTVVEVGSLYTLLLDLGVWSIYWTVDLIVFFTVLMSIKLIRNMRPIYLFSQNSLFHLSQWTDLTIILVRSMSPLKRHPSQNLAFKGFNQPNLFESLQTTVMWKNFSIGLHYRN